MWIGIHSALSPEIVNAFFVLFFFFLDRTRWDAGAWRVTRRRALLPLQRRGGVVPPIHCPFFSYHHHVFFTFLSCPSFRRLVALTECYNQKEQEVHEEEHYVMGYKTVAVIIIMWTYRVHFDSHLFVNFLYVFRQRFQHQSVAPWCSIPCPFWSRVTTLDTVCWQVEINDFTPHIELVCCSLIQWLGFPLLWLKLKLLLSSNLDLGCGDLFLWNFIDMHKFQTFGWPNFYGMLLGGNSLFWTCENTPQSWHKCDHWGPPFLSCEAQKH